MSTLEDQILSLIKTSLIKEEIKTAWQAKLPALTQIQQNELLRILQSEQEMIKKTILEEQQKNTAKNQEIYKQLIIDMKNLAKTFQKTGLKNAEQKLQTEETNILKSLEQELSNL